jgi:hypothetical protein
MMIAESIYAAFLNFAVAVVVAADVASAIVVAQFETNDHVSL